MVTICPSSLLLPNVSCSLVPCALRAVSSSMYVGFFFVLSMQCLICNVQCPVSSVQRPVSSVQVSVSDIRYPVYSVHCPRGFCLSNNLLRTQTLRHTKLASFNWRTSFVISFRPRYETTDGLLVTCRKNTPFLTLNCRDWMIVWRNRSVPLTLLQYVVSEVMFCGTSGSITHRFVINVAA